MRQPGGSRSPADRRPCRLLRRPVNRTRLERVSNGLGRVSNRKGRPTAERETLRVKEQFESVAVDLGQLVDVNDEVEVSLVPDEISQQVVHAGCARGRELPIHGDNDVLCGPTNGDTQTSRWARGRRPV
jgi:hypothetical protein